MTNSSSASQYCSDAVESTAFLVPSKYLREWTVHWPSMNLMKTEPNFHSVNEITDGVSYSNICCMQTINKANTEVKYMRAEARVAPKLLVIDVFNSRMFKTCVRKLTLASQPFESRSIISLSVSVPVPFTRFRTHHIGVFPIFCVIYWELFHITAHSKSHRKSSERNGLISMQVCDQYKLNPNKRTHFVPSFSTQTVNIANDKQTDSNANKYNFRCMRFNKNIELYFAWNLMCAARRRLALFT